MSRILPEPFFWAYEILVVFILEAFVRSKVSMLIYIPILMFCITSGVAIFSWLLERKLRPARRLKFLGPEFKRCLKIIEGDSDYETIRAIEWLSPQFKEFDIEIPPLYKNSGTSAFRGSVRFWRDFLERLIVLTEEDISLETLKEARKICKELLK